MGIELGTKATHRQISSPVPLAASRRTLHGFSLVELMMATAIFSLLVVILASVAQNVGNAWVYSQGRTARRQSARAIIDFITRDIQNALSPIVPSSTNNLQFIRNPATLTADNYQSGHTLFWQAPVSSNPGHADVAILGYFVRWSANHKASLCRLYITMANPGEYLINSAPANWINDTVVETRAPATPQSNYLGLMAENVVGFWAEPLDSYGKVITQPSKDFDSRAGYTDSQGRSHAIGSLPAAVRISIATLDPRSATRLSTSLQQMANDAENAEAFVAAVRADPSLKAIHQGIYSYTSSVGLLNSR